MQIINSNFGRCCRCYSGWPGMGNWGSTLFADSHNSDCICDVPAILLTQTRNNGLGGSYFSSKRAIDGCACQPLLPPNSNNCNKTRSTKYWPSTNIWIHEFHYCYVIRENFRSFCFRWILEWALRILFHKFDLLRVCSDNFDMARYLPGTKWSPRQTVLSNSSKQLARTI